MVQASTEILNDIGWLSMTAPPFRAAVQDRLATKRINAGEVIYQIGDPPGGLCAVVDGTVDFEMAGPSRVPHLVHFGSSGFWFGEGPLIAETPRRNAISARVSTVLATLSLQDCRAILDQDPANWRWIALLAKLKADLSDSITSELLLKDSRQRVAAALLRLTGSLANPRRPRMRGILRGNQHEIGEVTNLSRTVVNGITREFAESGLIRVEYRAIEILAEDALRAIAERDS